MMSLVRLPGLTDPHVHLRDPGQTEKEDFYTGTAAALAGGYTTIIDMPNNKIPVTTSDILGDKISRAKARIVCDVGFYFGSLGDNLAEFEKVAHKVLGLKLFLNNTTGGLILDPAMLEQIFLTWPRNLPILFHAEDKAFDSVLEVLKNHPRRIHLCHISTKYELQRIMEAKNNKLPVTCGVTPHHLFLTDEDEKHLGSFGLMKPMLKPKEDVEYLWKYLDAIDVIESDHAPHTKEEKTSATPFYGVPGLETTLPLLLTAVSESRLSLDKAIQLCHENPAKIFGIPADADTYIEVDLSTTFEIKNEALLTKCKWSPFNGWKAKGKVAKVCIRGTDVFENGNVLASPGSGNIINS